MRVIPIAIFIFSLASCAVSSERIGDLSAPPDPADSALPTVIVDVFDVNNTRQQRALIIRPGSDRYRDVPGECSDEVRTGWNLIPGNVERPLGSAIGYTSEGFGDSFITVNPVPEDTKTIYVVAEDDGGIAEIRLNLTVEYEIDWGDRQDPPSRTQSERATLSSVSGNGVTTFSDSSSEIFGVTITKTTATYIETFEAPLRRQGVAAITLDYVLDTVIGVRVIDGNGDRSSGSVFWTPDAMCGVRR